MNLQDLIETEQLIEKGKIRLFVAVDTTLTIFPMMLLLVYRNSELPSIVFLRLIAMSCAYGGLGILHLFYWKKFCRLALTFFGMFYTFFMLFMDLDYAVGPLAILLSVLVSQVLFMFEEQWQKRLIILHLIFIVGGYILKFFLLPTEGCILNAQLGKRKILSSMLIMVIIVGIWSYYIQISNQIFTNMKEFSFLRDKEVLEKQNFFASMSHEIRNPIQTLMGSLELIIPLIEDNQENEQLATIARNCCEIVLNLVSNILDISKLQAGKIVLAPTASDPREAVMRVVRLQKMKAESKGLRMQLTDDRHLPTILNLDSFRLSQVVLNLVSNSIKFTQKGGIYIKFQWETHNSQPEREDNEDVSIPEERPNHSLVSGSLPLLYSNFPERRRSLSVSRNEEEKKETKGKLIIIIEDTGIGISEENLAKLFQPYSQADSSICKRFGGTGLGLWISQSIIHLMGGEISVSSEINKGSKFVISIPTEVGTEEQLLAKPNEVSYSLLSMKNKSCIILDDIIENCTILQQYFKRAEMKSHCFIDGRTALAFYHSNSKQIDIILTDLRMPTMSGQTFITEIRKFELENKRKPVPIVVISAESGNEVKVECLSKLGANAFLLKPVQLSDLHKTMSSLIDQSMNANKNIMIVEDEKISGVFLKKVISSMGHTVTLCQNISSAKEHLNNNYEDIELVFLDNTLPDGSGEDLLAFIQELKAHHKTHCISIISMSGMDSQYQQHLYRNYQIAAFLQKPLRKTEVIQLISHKFI